MRNIARLSDNDRRELFRNTADKMGLNDAIVEKDFWVCFTLDYLFHRSPWKESITFKGGTSLSKAFHLISRFSEDIDLILDWRVLGYGKDEPWEKRSNTKQDAFNKEANVRAEVFLSETFCPAVKAGLSQEIGCEANVYIDEKDKQTVIFAYPHLFTNTATLQVIRLEIGALAAWTPAKTAQIEPYAAKYYPKIFEQKETCTVPTPVTETGLIDMEHRSEFLKDTDTLPLKHDLFSVDAVILDQLKSRAVTLKSKKHNKGIRIDFNQFPYLILWSTAKEADFVALEPWIGLSTCSDEGDKFEEKRNIQYAQAGEVKEYEFHINIL